MGVVEPAQAGSRRRLDPPVNSGVDSHHDRSRIEMDAETLATFVGAWVQRALES